MRFFVSAIAAFCITACGEAATTQQVAETPTTTVETPALSDETAKPSEPTIKPSEAVATPAPQRFGAAELLGRWGDEGDCRSNLVEFRRDGVFHSYVTGADGRWSLSGDELTMSGSGGTFVVHVQWSDANHMRVIQADGSAGSSQRC